MNYNFVFSNVNVYRKTTCKGILNFSRIGIISMELEKVNRQQGLPSLLPVTSQNSLKLKNLIHTFRVNEIFELSNFQIMFPVA